MVLDFEGIMKKNVDKIFAWFNLDDDPIYTTRFKKVIKWFAYKFSPFVLNVASFIILVYIFNKIHDNYGLDKVIIIGFVIIIFSIRSLSKALKPDFD